MPLECLLRCSPRKNCDPWHLFLPNISNALRCLSNPLHNLISWKHLQPLLPKLMSWCRCNLHFLFLEVLDLMVDNSVCNQHSSHGTWGKLDRNGSGVQIFLGCLSHPTVFASRIYFGKRKAQPFPHIVEQVLGLDKLKRQALPFDAMMPLTCLWRRAHQAGDGTGHKLWNKCELFSYFCTYMPQQHGLNC